MSIPLRGPTGGATWKGRKLLQRALVVVHFSPVLKISDQTGSGIAAFQEEVRDTYPDLLLEFENLVQFEIRPDGAMEPSMQRQPVWRLFDLQRQWRLSITSQSVALEADGEAYTTWSDFSGRVHRLIQAVGANFQPAQVRRVGVRYVNSAGIDNGDDPRKDCVGSLVSISGEPELLQADLAWRFPVDEGALLLRSGIAAENSTYDPGVFDPVNYRRWYLDIDVFNDRADSFISDEICKSILAQVQRAHEIYKWALPGPLARGEG